jgi:hypothetical protein
MTAATINGTGLTISRAVATDGSKNLVSSATTATELGYVNGVTSAIQTQLNTKGTVSSVTATNGVNSVSGAAITGTGGIILNLAQINGFRLTLSTAAAIPTTDISGGTTIYLYAYTSDEMSLYIDATQQWVLYKLSGTPAQAISIPATTNTGYDVFAYASSGVITLELSAWTSLTSRTPATNLALQDGVLVKSTDFTRRYLGSFRTTASLGQCDDTATARYLWNYYNRARRPLLRQEGTVSWNYTLATVRQANASTNNQVNFFVGFDLDAVDVQVFATYQNAVQIQAGVGVGLDSITAMASASLYQYVRSLAGSGATIAASYKGYLGAIGAHYLAWLEFSQVGGTTSWFGLNTSASVTVQNGMIGTCFT